MMVATAFGDLSLGCPHLRDDGLGFVRVAINGGITGVSAPTTVPTAVRSAVTGGPLFTDPKLNAMREAAVAGDWRKLFQIAPRGCVGPVGPTLADGTRGVCSDDPNMPVGSRAGQAAYDFWTGRNPLRKNLALEHLRYKKNAAGRVVAVPLMPAEIRNFYQNFSLSRGDWFCEPGQLEEYIAKVTARQLPMWPIAICAEPSRRRHRKIIKKVAIAAAVVTGAVMFGPALLSKAGAILGGAAPGGVAGAAGIAPGVGIGAAGGASAAAASGLTSSAIGGMLAGVTTAGTVAGLSTKALPYANKLFNATRTVRALADGELPPPPISFGDMNFTDWSTLVGKQIAEREMRQDMTEAEAALLRQYVEDERRRLAAAEQPHYPVVNTGLNPELTAAQKSRADSFLSGGNVPALMMLGVPMLFLLAKG